MFVQRIDTDPERLALSDSPPTIQTPRPDPAAFYSLRTNNEPTLPPPFNTPQAHQRDADCEETPVQGAPIKTNDLSCEESSDIEPRGHEETSTCSSVPFESDRKSYGPALDLAATILFSYQLAKLQAQNIVDGGDFVFFFVIPRRKRNGDLNTVWDSAEMITDEDTHRLDFMGQDPHNLDTQFRLVIPSTVECRSCQFLLRCPSNGECDGGPAGRYQIDFAQSPIWTLRDGMLTGADGANEIGVVLEMDETGTSDQVQTLHYWDEVDNVWRSRAFTKGFDRFGIRGKACYLSHVKRVIFVIQTSSGSYIKGPGGENLVISWPGIYYVGSDGSITEAETNI